MQKSSEELKKGHQCQLVSDLLISVSNLRKEVKNAFPFKHFDILVMLP